MAHLGKQPVTTHHVGTVNLVRLPRAELIKAGQHAAHLLRPSLMRYRSHWIKSVGPQARFVNYIELCHHELNLLRRYTAYHEPLERKTCSVDWQHISLRRGRCTRIFLLSSLVGRGKLRQLSSLYGLRIILLTVLSRERH